MVEQSNNTWSQIADGAHQRLLPAGSHWGAVIPAHYHHRIRLALPGTLLALLLLACRLPTLGDPGRTILTITVAEKGPEVHTREIVIEYMDGRREAVTNNEVIDDNPSFSPGGSFIAFERTDDTNGDGIADFNDTADIYFANVDGSDARNLTNHPAQDLMHTWSPDGDRLAFYSDRDGNGDVYTIEVATGRVERLTTNSGWGAHPAWSPDGRQIAFYANEGAGSFLAIIGSDGLGYQQLSGPVGNGWGIQWTTDGRIRFLWQGEAYVIKPDGSGMISLDHAGMEIFLIDQAEYGWGYVANTEN